MKSLYGRDYIGIRPQVPGKRLKLITHLLTYASRNASTQNVASEVLKRIEARMESAAGKTRKAFASRNADFKFRSGDTVAAVGGVDKNRGKIRGNSKTRFKMHKTRLIQPSPEKDFTVPDFESLVDDFGISRHDAKEILQLFQSCFDRQGSFLRTAFEKNVPQFARLEKKVFEILWQFLKQTPQRSNRLPFLNSLQLLVAETKKPIQAIKVLLADFTRNPQGVYYPDRNAVMLLNQLLRAYNKEAVMDIENTPEEVLLVKAGLEASVVNYVAWKVDGGQKMFPNKIAAIRKSLVEAMEPDVSEAQLLPIRFLLALEREVHIFLALIGGRIALEVMRDALKVYGNPSSRIYHLRESPLLRETLLLHLAAVIRGLGRVGHPSDVFLLDEIKMRPNPFANSLPDRRYQILSKHVMGLIDESRAAISARNN